jgi:hypothetical protein
MKGATDPVDTVGGKEQATTFSTVSWCLLGTRNPQAPAHTVTHATSEHASEMGSQPFHTELVTDGSASLLLLAIQNRHTAVSHPGGSLSQK